ncbi:phage tail tube protein [Nitrosopumilus sp.]|uniref:phage tail tube protein n=1 Tax=Nitrosopumilus sp. TaxID=2024843 RepID=UPI003D0B4A02
MPVTGASAYVQYGYESTFKGGATQTKVFGCENKLTGLRLINNTIGVKELYTPEIKKWIFGKTEGFAQAEWIISNPWFFDFIFTTPESTGSDPYEHKWSSDPDFVGAGAFDNTSVRNVKSGHLEIGIDAETENVVRNAKGVIVPSLTLRTTINDAVKASMSLIWGKEDSLSTTLDSTPASDDIQFPYTFVHASLELPNGTVIAQIQDFELNFEPNVELIWGVGSAEPSGKSGKKIIEMSGRFKKAIVDQTMLQYVIDRQELATLEITLSNGLSGSNERSITLLGTGVAPADHDKDLVPGEIIFENLKWNIRSMLVTAVNSTATPP